MQRNPVVWMIMWDGQRYPAYNMTLPSGIRLPIKTRAQAGTYREGGL